MIIQIFSDFEEYVYNNARSEFVYLCSPSLLRNASADKAGGKRILDAIYLRKYLPSFGFCIS
jgi:hypothetical protein